MTKFHVYFHRKQKQSRVASAHSLMSGNSAYTWTCSAPNLSPMGRAKDRMHPAVERSLVLLLVPKTLLAIGSGQIWQLKDPKTIRHIHQPSSTGINRQAFERTKHFP